MPTSEPVRLSDPEAELLALAQRAVDRAAPGSATVTSTGAGGDSLMEVEIRPQARGAAVVSLVHVGGEVSGQIGHGAFYAPLETREDVDELEDLVALVAAGRVEERWSLGCKLRARPRGEPGFTFGVFSPIPWWACVPRRFSPYA